MVDLFLEAGLPAGVLNVITGHGSVVGEALIAHPDVRRVALTGSSATGRRAMEIAGSQFKRVTLELGGSDPVIVCPDADLEITEMIDAIFIDPKRNRNFYLAYINLIDQAARHRRFNELSATFRSIVDAQYAEVIEAGIAEGAFRQDDAQQAAMVVRAIVDSLFLQWLQERDWERVHPAYKEACRQAIVAYLCREVHREAATL